MKLTYVIIILCIFSFIYVALQPPKVQERIVNKYGFSGKNMVTRPWTFVTTVFLHADISHLLSNMLILLFFGAAVEKELGGGKFIFLFFGGALLGSLFSLFIYPFDSISIGASAGIFSLIGAGMLLRPFDFSLYPYIIPVPLGLLGLLYILYNVIGFVTDPVSEISYIAHFGGLILGLFVGFKEKGIKEGIKTIMFILVIAALIPLFFLLFEVLFF